MAYFTYIKTMDPDKRFTTVIKNLKKNYGKITADYKTLQDDYNSKNYFGVGQQAEILATTVIPPAQTIYLQ